MMVTKKYRASVIIRREPNADAKGRPCGHVHRIAESASACGVSIIRRHSSRRDGQLIQELGFRIEYTHSRHDWFPL